ncbi:exocyst complex component 6B [Pleuronectes platessa]|uniref:exocyst complex component 6B n=1 Tax=Pleuronectes platessa TaxID=8262 RepID=UPI00232A4246|nr:exocyst complex component 6B [Pleuronectes platessa]
MNESKRKMTGGEGGGKERGRDGSGQIVNSPRRRTRRECVKVLTERCKKSEGSGVKVCSQLLELFTEWDWSTYLADYGKSTCKYLRVNPHTALVLLEKMKETSRKNNVFAQFRKTDRDRQKLIDTVIKQLRNLIAQHHA